MKVIYTGTKPEDILFQLGCSYCETVVELVAKELTKDEGDRKCIPCPTCHHSIVDNIDNRKRAVSIVAKHKKEEYRDYGDSGWSSSGNDRSGGASGPLNPPDLPHYVHTIKAFAMVK